MTRIEADQLLDDALKKQAMLLDATAGASQPDSILIRTANKLVSDVKARIDRELDPWEKPSPKCEKALERFITVDPEMLLLKKQIMRVVNVQDSVLIYGQSGTGKELLAQALHGERVGNFVPLNCAGFPEGLIESELFGHARGSFTGADYAKSGLIEAANNGTLFLDEIGEMPLASQAKLLRFLQDSKCRRVGELQQIEWKVRIVCATNQDIPEMVKQKKFRLDLYARLSRIEFVTTPLDLRRSDIQPIVNSIDSSGKAWKGIGERLLVDPLSLNVRSIENAIRRFQLFGDI